MGKWLEPEQMNKAVEQIRSSEVFQNFKKSLSGAEIAKLKDDGETVGLIDQWNRTAKQNEEQAKQNTNGMTPRAEEKAKNRNTQIVQ